MGHVWAHRADVESGAELLLDARPYGWVTARLERMDVVLTGAAGEPGGFGPVLDAMEAYFQAVYVETYREGIVKMLQDRGYSVDHVRLFKK